jgi:peptidoglycan/LPS O-acetylase OafA/YrhL
VKLDHAGGGEATASATEAERGRRPELRHEPALDGLRGVAIIAVLLYHGGVPWAQGGYFGVEAFFVLSGFLITSLLLAEWGSSRGVRLGRFWARRARRLLPALFCVVAATAIQQTIVGVNGAVPDFRVDGIATLFYFANWHAIATGTGYFAQTALVSPLQHTWSLAIEEQFYLVWPLLLLGVLKLSNPAQLRRRHSRDGSRGAGPRLWPLLVVAITGALASAIEMGVLYHLGTPLERVWAYYGTDTRAQGLLAGAALAIGLTMVRSRRRASPDGPEAAAEPESSIGWIVLQVAGVVGAVALVASIVAGRGDVGWWYEGGWLGVDVAALLVIWSFATDSSRLSVTRTVFSFIGLRATGVISYGLYLWHFPLFLWLNVADTGVGGWKLLALRVGGSFGAAIASYFGIEQPIRQRRVPVVVTRVLAPVGLSGALAAVMVAGNVAAAVPLPPQPSPTATTRLIPTRWTGKPTVTCREQLPVASPRGPVFAVFHTCPPERVMLIGDSVGQSLGFQLGVNEERYGVVLQNDTLLGCGYVEAGLVGAPGSWADFSSVCSTAYQTWKLQAAKFHPQVVVVEMGWWDSMDHLINGEDVYLGEASYDAYLVQRMDQLVDDVDGGGAKVVFLSVPWMLPPPWPNGEEMPAALSYRHFMINKMLQTAADDRPGRAFYFDIGPEVTPAGHFEADVGGSICRTSDGIHFYWGTSVFKIPATYCGEKLQAALLPWVRELVPAKSPPTTSISTSTSTSTTVATVTSASG